MRTFLAVSSSLLLTAALAIGAAGSATQPSAGELGAWPSTENWDRVLRDVTIEGDVVVPPGERWLIGPNVRIAGNLRTEAGTIAMRPGSSLHFVGADPDRYVGGGMGYSAEFSDDLGLWIGSEGVLDIRGTPKVGWNRTGQDPTWRAEDELWIAPTAPGDYEPRRWRPGDPIPQVDPRAPSAEVMNVTRDVLIEGPGHIHISSRHPQRVEYVTLRQMGIFNRRVGMVSGRYALHLHHGGSGAAGTVIRGVAAIDSRGHVFVPHETHGLTFVDNVSVNSWGNAFWWDSGDYTNDLLVDRLAVSGVHLPRAVSRSTSRQNGVTLGSGHNLEVRNSVVSGVRGSKLSVGWNWSTRQAHRNQQKWTFETGNVAHNNQGPAIRFWFNDALDHLVRNVVTYHNGVGGIENGAYANANRYADLLLIGDGIIHHSGPKRTASGQISGYERVHVHASRGPAVDFGRVNLRGETGVRVEFIDCTLRGAPGYPAVRIDQNGKTKNPVRALFRRCGIGPEDIEIVRPFSRGLEGTSIVIEAEDGRVWEITADLESDRQVVRELTAPSVASVR
jgi:hypothetical protein